MKRLLLLAIFVGLLTSVGCKDEKTIAPKEIPKQPDGPPTGVKSGNPPANKSGPVSP